MCIRSYNGCLSLWAYKGMEMSAENFYTILFIISFFILPIPIGQWFWQDKEEHLIMKWAAGIMVMSASAIMIGLFAGIFYVVLALIWWW